jgi:uncharacterized membrane protein
MVWLWLPIAAAFCYALSGFMDNFLVDTHCRKLDPKCMSMLYVIIELVICVVIVVVTGGAVLAEVGLVEVGIFMLAALMNFFGSIPYYRALKNDETTEVALLGQMAPVFALVLAWALLGEEIEPLQLVAFFMILSMALFLVLGAGRGLMKIKAGAAGCMVLACFFWVMSDVVFVWQARENSFITSFFWLMMGGVVANTIAFIVVKRWRQDLRKFLKRKRGRKLALVALNETMYLAGEVIWRFGVVIMPVAIMSVTGHVSQLILTFVLGVALTLLSPKFGREKLSRKLVTHHALATGVVALAVALLS